MATAQSCAERVDRGIERRDGRADDTEVGAAGAYAGLVAHRGFRG